MSFPFLLFSFCQFSFQLLLWDKQTLVHVSPETATHGMLFHPAFSSSAASISHDILPGSFPAVGKFWLYFGVYFCLWDLSPGTHLSKEKKSSQLYQLNALTRWWRAQACLKSCLSSLNWEVQSHFQFWNFSENLTNPESSWNAVCWRFKRKLEAAAPFPPVARSIHSWSPDTAWKKSHLSTPGKLERQPRRVITSPCWYLFS